MMAGSDAWDGSESDGMAWHGLEQVMRVWITCMHERDVLELGMDAIMRMELQMRYLFQPNCRSLCLASNYTYTQRPEVG